MTRVNLQYSRTLCNQQKEMMTMKTTINSRKHGVVTFFTSGKGKYVWVDLNGQPGTLGNQICDGGKLMGNTISSPTDDPEKFGKFCRLWWKAFMRRQIS